MDEHLSETGTTEQSLQAGRLPFNSIPSVNLDPWFHGSARHRLLVARAVNYHCRNVGFLYINGHGIPQTLIESVFEQAERFFALPDEEKLKIHYRQSDHYRGYLPLNAESSDSTAKADIKEAFDCGLVVQPSTPNALAAKRMLAPNLWPNDLPGFRKTIEEYLAALMRLARELFRIFSLGLGISEDYFDRKISEPIATLRLLRYPPQETPQSRDYLGIGTHCDYECFTILAQDEIGGLQVQNTKGEWIEVPPLPGTFVVNIGEMLMRWTNEVLIAAPHRVFNSTGRERFSIPFFFATDYDVVIECLESCCGKNAPAKYQPVRSGDYLARRLKEIYGF